MSDLEDPLLCPICFDTPMAEIFQCKNGHCICSQCVSSLLKCPQCRIPYTRGKIRNRALEALLDSLTFSCPHEKRGCTLKIKREHKEAHARKCQYNPANVSLCPIIGYKKCNFIIDPSNIYESIDHFVHEHDFRLNIGFHCDIRHQSFKNVTDATCTQKAEYTGWQPLIMIEPTSNIVEYLANIHTQDEVTPAAFLVFSKIFGARSSISWYCIQLGLDNENKSQLFEVEFQIQENSIKKNTSQLPSRLPELRWKVTPLKYFETKAICDKFPMQFRTDALTKNYREMVGDSLLLKVSIRRKWKQDRKGTVVNLAVAPWGSQAPPLLSSNITTTTTTLNTEMDDFVSEQNLNMANSNSSESKNINSKRKTTITLMDFIASKWFAIVLMIFCYHGGISVVTLFWFWAISFIISFFRK